jgi:MFS family permease
VADAGHRAASPGLSTVPAPDPAVAAGSDSRAADAAGQPTESRASGAAGAPGRSGWGGSTFGSLHTRNYRLFATGQVISNSGSWMQRVAQDWLVLSLTHNSGTALGITTGLQFAPMLFSMWGGAVADRYSKRGILMVTQALMGGLALILGVLALTGTVQIWHVYLLAFALGMVTVVDNPTRQAFAVEMVGKEGMANAIALNSAVFNLARIGGPAIAGLVIAAAGTPAAFLVNAASYGAVLIGLKLMRPEELHQVARAPRGKGQLREALSYVRARPRLWMTLILIFFVSTFGMNFQVTTALMAKGVFHAGAGEFGVASAVFAFGALGGALIAARRARPTLSLLVATAFAFSVFEIISGLMPDFLAFLIMLVPTGLTLLTLTTAANSTMQLGTTAAMRGRVMGLYMLVFLGGTPLGSPLCGWVAELFGPRMSIISGGVISVIATVVVGLMLTRRRGVPARSLLRPAQLARLVA